MKNQSSAITIGLGLGDRRHAVCVGRQGRNFETGNHHQQPRGLVALSRRYPGAQVADGGDLAQEGEGFTTALAGEGARFGQLGGGFAKFT